MKLPSNTLTVSKGIEATFDFLINPENYLQLLKDECNGKIVYDKMSPIEKGKLYKLIIPAEKGQLVIELELEEFIPPHTLKYNILSVMRKRKKKEEPLPMFMFVDRVACEINLRKSHGNTNVKFTNIIEGAQGFITNSFIYVFFGVFGWFSNRKHLAKLKKLITKNANEV